MYHLFSPQVIIDNVFVLASPYIEDKKNLNFASLKQGYRAYLKKIQPYCPLMDDDQLFYADSATEELLKNYFTESDSLDMTEINERVDVDNVMYPDAEQRCAVLQKAFARMTAKDSIFADVFKLVMNTVFCTVSKNLGSTSMNPSYLGVMCAHHDMHGVEEVVPELLLHEFAHNTILLDEHRYGHYHYELLSNPETFLDASDRGVHFKFPLNRVLHSMLVAAEIISLRNAYVGHEPQPNQHLTTAEIIIRSQKYIAAIDANPKLLKIFTKRGAELYQRARDFFKL